MRVNYRTLSAGSNILASNSHPTSECSTARESEPVSDQLDRLNSILSNMMKDLIETPLPHADSASLSHRKIPPFITPLKLQNLNSTQSELEEDSINGFSYPMSINYTEEDRMIEIDLGARLEQEFLNHCRHAMILEDFRSHELRSFYRLQDDDFSLENLTLKNDSFDSPVSFKHTEEIEASVLCQLASDLNAKLGINISSKNSLEFVTGIEEILSKDIQISLKELSSIEVIVHEMIDSVENGQEVRREMSVGPFKIVLHVNEVYGAHLLSEKRRIAKSLSMNEGYQHLRYDSDNLASCERYIKQLESEIRELRLELSLRPEADAFSKEIQNCMQNAFEEDLKTGDIDARSLDFRYTSFSSASSSESKFSNTLELELKTLKAKKDEIDKLKIGVEWQLQELIFIKKEYEQRQEKLKEKEDLIEREHANVKVKEKEVIQQQDILYKLRKDLENIKYKINYEKMQLDREKSEFIRIRADFEKEQKLKSIEALNLKEHIQRLLSNKQELTEQFTSVVNLLNEKEQKIEENNSGQDRGRKSEIPASRARFSSGSPSRLSSEVMATMSLAELQTLKTTLENELKDPSLNDISRRRLEINISRISTQLADMRYKKTIDILKDTDKEAEIIHKMIDNIDKIQLPFEDQHKRTQTVTSYSASSTPLAGRPRKPLSFTHNAVDDFSNYIASPKTAPLPEEASPLPQRPREAAKPPTGRTKHKAPMKLIPLNLNKISEMEASTDNSSTREDAICEKELLLVDRENLLQREMLKLKGKEEELRNLEKMLEAERTALSQERFELLKKEKEWQTTWNKLPNADELIPIIQQGHLQVMRELDAFERKKKVLDKDKIEISKYWKQVAEAKKLIATQMKEVTQAQRENIRERKALDKMRKDFATLLPALQAMIRLAH